VTVNRVAKEPALTCVVRFEATGITQLQSLLSCLSCEVSTPVAIAIPFFDQHACYAGSHEFNPHHIIRGTAIERGDQIPHAIQRTKGGQLD
jgi:hypothetical protein